ncbi:MAG: PQQ-binding-like beta-propeller repeat protein [Patescibacteria group bacterium]|nr:PQQ-binding-like beta-propeller repeat protein [Patescibacteria group bacterium]
MKKLFIFISALLATLSLIVTYQLGDKTSLSLSPKVQAQAINYDWPTLAHDSKRSGSAQEGPDGPYTKVWYRDFWSEFGEQVDNGYQPIVAHNNNLNKDIIYIGITRGAIYALDNADGSIIWRYPKQGYIGGILNSPTYDNGILYVGSLDGNVYALNTSSTSGSNPAAPAVVWTFKTGREGGFWATPAVTNDSVYIGGRDGYFYAIDKNNGSKRWEYQVGFPILTSPAVENNTIYFGAEDMKGYALNTSGNLIWKSNQMAGQTMKGEYPVLTGDKVIFRTSPNDMGHSKLEAMNVLTYAAGCLDDQAYQGDIAPNWANTPCFKQKFISTDPGADPVKEDQTIRDYLSGKSITFTTTNTATPRQITIPGRPQYETFFALNKSDGQKPYISPVLYTGGYVHPGVAPVIDPTGKVWVVYRSYYSDWDDTGNPQMFEGLGTINMQTGTITPFNPNQHPTGYSCTTASCNPVYNTNMWFIGDETTAISLTSNRLYTNHWSGLGEADTTNGNLQSIIGQRDVFQYKLTDNSPHLGPFNSYGDGINPPSVVESKGPTIFRDTVVVNYNSVVAAMRGHLAGTTPTPISTITPYPVQTLNPTTAGPVNIPTQTELEKYIWEIPQVSNIDNAKSADLQAKLNSEVSKFITTGMLNPWILAFSIANGIGYWAEPLQTGYYLSLAYPYLSPQLQAQVKTFINNDFTNIHPLGNVYDYLRTARYPWDSGLTYDNGQILDPNHKERSPYIIGPHIFCQIKGNCDGNPYENTVGYIPSSNFGIDRLYYFWSYAQRSGDWSWIENYWDNTSNPGRASIKRLRVLANIDTASDASLLGIGSATDPTCITYNCRSIFDSVNRRVSGLIAYARIAYHMNQIAPSADNQAELDWAVDAATKAMQARLRYVNIFRPIDGNCANGNLCWTTSSSEGGLFIQKNGWNNTNIPQYFDLIPEVSRLLSDYAMADFTRYNNFIDAVTPLAYLQKGGSSFDGEASYVAPHNIQGIFLAKDLVLHQPGDQLRTYLDIPWVDQDYYYWERLARTIEAYGTTTWVNLGIAGRDALTDINQDDRVDLLDLQVLFENWNMPRDRRADVNGDGVVNSIDFTLVLKDWGK